MSDVREVLEAVRKNPVRLHDQRGWWFYMDEVAALEALADERDQLRADLAAARKERDEARWAKETWRGSAETAQARIRVLEVVLRQVRDLLQRSSTFSRHSAYLIADAALAPPGPASEEHRAVMHQMYGSAPYFTWCECGKEGCPWPKRLDAPPEMQPAPEAKPCPVCGSFDHERHHG